MLSENANKVLAARYLLKDDAGNSVETVSEMFSRVANTLAEGSRQHLPRTATEQEMDRAIASIAKRYYDVLYNPEFDSPDFLPNSPTLANAGARTGQLSACFVQKIEDTLSNGKNGIYDTLLKAQLIQQTGGGVGYSMSRLRPAGARVHSTKGISTGPMAFADVYDTACGALAQGGMRRGAQMLVLLVTHPDIMQFIAYKADLSKLNNFNVSVAVTDDFMLAVEHGTTYALIDPHTELEVGRLDAREVFKAIAKRAWTTGEPGVVFIDRMNAYNPVRWLGDYESTNPCFAAGTMVLTSDGDFPIEDLVGQVVTVWDGFEWREIDNFRVTGADLPVYDLMLSNGQSVRATGYHKFILEDGSRKELLDLRVGDKLRTHDFTAECIDATGISVAAVVPAGVADKVYCCTVEGSHSFALSNGLLVGQCGEQPLLPDESCNLGSINLENFVVDEYHADFTVTNKIDWSRLRGVIHTATYMMDDIINVNRFPLPELKQMSDATRKLGLGIMGFARMLFKLEIPYGSPAAEKIAAQIMSFLDYESKIASVELSILRGIFPARSGHITESNAFFKRVCDERQVAEGKHPDCDYARLPKLIETYGIRNSNTTTIAPTGTLSIIANTSGGCEPVFALAFTRKQANMVMQDADPVFQQKVFDLFGASTASAIINGVAAHHGSLQAYVLSMKNFEGDACYYTSIQHEALRELAQVFVTAHDLSPTQHVLTQAAFQRFNDSACSKTINHDNSATIEDIEAAYLLAYRTGCKGITVYRDGCRTAQPLSTGPTVVLVAQTVVSMAVPETQPGTLCPNEGCGLPLKKQEGCSSCVCGYSACSVG